MNERESGKERESGRKRERANVYADFDVCDECACMHV